MDVRVVGEIIYKKTANGVQWSHGVRYIYGDDGSVIGFGLWDADTVNEWERYYFIKNVQGDVLHVYREADNTLVASYEYDPFGNCETTYCAPNDSDHIAEQNPFRYRGYYYDTETGFYYLQSRYYDPTTCRFINADSFVSTGQDFVGYNMFAYCGNNPVMGFDPTGEVDWGGVIAGIGIALTGVIVVATFGVGSPVAAVVAASTITTGSIMTYAAATDSAMVVDTSVTTPSTNGLYFKSGVSMVVDFSKNEVNSYGHAGGGFGCAGGLSYSVGVVSNYEEPDDYARHFVDINVGNYVGVDHCWNPVEAYDEAVRATSITFSSGFGYGVGYDYYFNPHQIFAW